MDVTNLNFLELLPEIADNIRECEFIAIDTEMSGLLREKSNNIFDLPEERFSKHVRSSRGYFIMQFGLSCFTRRSASTYDSKTYNFYIFPQANEELGGDINRTFSLQAHAIQFLSQNEFDFNKLFKYGISYLTFEEKKALTAELKFQNKLRSKILEKSELGDSSLPKFVPANLMSVSRVWLKKVKKFIESARETHASGDAKPSEDVFMDTNSMSGCPSRPPSPVLELKDCSSPHRRKVLRKLLECQPFWGNIEIVEKQNPDTNEAYLTVAYVDKAEKEEKEKRAFMKAKGFLEVLELIVKEKKPLVGHNLTLDLIQIINQFIEPLADDYSSFKEICHQLFPLIYDTKFIAHSILDPETLSNNQSRLYDLYCQLRDSESLPKIKVNHLNEFSDENQHSHQAGFDAFMTGYSFLVLVLAFLEEQRRYKKRDSDSDIPTVKSIAEEREIVEELANRIHLSYSYDFKYFNITEDELMPDRSHIFYVEYPHTWGLDDLYQIFSPYGGVTVSMLNKTSALCALRDAKNKNLVTQWAKKAAAAHSTYKVLSYDAYLANHGLKQTKKDSIEAWDNEISCE